MAQCTDPPAGDNKSVMEEYKLAIEVQIHFNELLMKLRSFGLTAVVVVFGWAVTRSQNEASSTFQVQMIIACGLGLLVAVAIVDLLYFFPLLLGAVDRSGELEKLCPTLGLTRQINRKVPRPRAYRVLILFYAIVFVLGIILLVSAAPLTDGSVPR